MKRIKLITLLTLLSTGMNLHAGCWIPESDTIKNHYPKKDGGYVRIRTYLPYVHRGYWTGGRGAVDKEYHLRLKGKYDVFGRFTPTGFKTKNHREVQEEEGSVILTMARKYWPVLGGHLYFSPTIELPNKNEYPCYGYITDASFEKWKRLPHISPKQQKEQAEKEKKQKEKEKEQKAEEKKRRAREEKQKAMEKEMGKYLQLKK